MRQPEIALPAGEARCVPSKPCPQAGMCARALASATPGAPVADYTLSALYLHAMCPHRLDPHRYRQQAPAAPAPRVHDAPQGLR